MTTSIRAERADTRRPQEGNPIQAAWDRLSRLPLGKRLFSRGVGWFAPYTGTIAGQVLELGPGYSKLRMRDCRSVRNHLASIHAIAQMNLAEEASGLAMLYGLPADARAILTGLEIEYVKKARGMLTAEGRAEVPSTSERREIELEVEVTDEAGDVVSRARARWLIGPKTGS